MASQSVRAAKDSDLLEASRQSDNERNNLFHCPRSESAGSVRHILGKAVHNAHGPPYLYERRSPFPERRPSPRRAAARSREQAYCASPAYSRSHSCGFSLWVNATGDNCAACRISSEYAFPMPLRMRGSVRARLRVRFSTMSASRKELRSLERTSIPPGSIERNASSPSKRCKDARRLVPASVSTSDP